jgi:hypothetical protein
VTTKRQYFLDMIELDKPEFEYTDSGLLRAKGAIARVGTMEYLTKDGDTYYQYVPPSTLFDPTHLKSIAGLPVTLFHPMEDVTPENYKVYSVGSTGDRVISRLDKGLVEVVLTIGDAEAIAKVKDGINQLSMGYWADLEEDPEKSDTYIQTKRIGNHIALVDKARGGEQLKLNLDSYNVVKNITAIDKSIDNQFTNTKEQKQWQILSVIA